MANDLLLYNNNYWQEKLGAEFRGNNLENKLHLIFSLLVFLEVNLAQFLAFTFSSNIEKVKSRASIQCMRCTWQSSGVYCRFKMETRCHEMEVRERLLGIVVLMPWSRTEAVVLRRRGVCGFVWGLLWWFWEDSALNWGEGIRVTRTPVWINAALDDDILNTQIKTYSPGFFAGNLWDAYE